MARIKYNHAKMMESTAIVGNIRKAIPGSIVWFNYKSETSFDKKPLVLYLYRDIKADPTLIHGLNLNYLTEKNIKKLISRIMEHKPVISVAEGITQDQSGRWRDEKGRFTAAPELSEKPHTRVNFKSPSPSAGKGERLAFYKKLKRIPFINIREVYRTYSEDKINAVKVIDLTL
tara:strand:- start:1793 stop:2314 length:522 start_codon:yes stop_codon:yes gene_type:complete